jgi:hypothetical protein
MNNNPTVCSSIIVPCTDDLIGRDQLRRRTLQRAKIPGLADIVDARIVETGVQLTLALPAASAPISARTASLEALDIVTDTASTWARVHDAGISVLGARSVSLSHDVVFVTPDGQVTLVGWSMDNNPVVDVSAFADWALTQLPTGSLSAEAAGLLMRALDDTAGTTTMTEISVALARARRATPVPSAPVSVASPLAHRRFESRVPRLVQACQISGDQQASHRGEIQAEPALAVLAAGRHRRAHGSKKTAGRPWRRVAVGAAGLVAAGMVLVSVWPAGTTQIGPACPNPATGSTGSQIQSWDQPT